MKYKEQFSAHLRYYSIRQKLLRHGFVAQRFHNYMILKVLIVFDPKLNLFKSDAYIFMQQSPPPYK